MNLITLIPAAGAGTRMRPLTNTFPKAMLMVAGKPILFHIVQAAIDAGSKEFVIIVEYLSKTITDSLPVNFPDIKFHFVKQGEMKGLGHAIFLAEKSCLNKPLLIIYGDTIFDGDLKSVVSKKYPQIGVMEVEDPRRFGIIEVDKDDFIAKFVEKPEKPTSNLAIPGVIFFPDSTPLFQALKYIIDNKIKTKGEYQVTDAYEKMIQDGHKMQYFKLKAWYDCGKHEETLSTNRSLLERSGNIQNGEIENCTVTEPNYISEGCVLKNCTIGPFTSIGKNNQIIDSKIKNSILGDSNSIKNCEISDSMIGNSCKLQKIEGKFILGDYSLGNETQD
jgi:glucose-1-phosphate thymidylyltransferase